MHASSSALSVLDCLLILFFFLLSTYVYDRHVLSGFLIMMSQKPGWKKFLSHVGPGFLVSLAYLDPGNCESLSLSLSLCMFARTRQTNIILWHHVTVETDLQAGANHRYEVNKLNSKKMDEYIYIQKKAF